MVRMLRRAGAKAEVLKWAELFKCQACQDTMKAKHPRPTRFADDFAFNIQVSTDVFTVHDIAGAPHHMLNLICEGACLLSSCRGTVWRQAQRRWSHRGRTAAASGMEASGRRCSSVSAWTTS